MLKSSLDFLISYVEAQTPWRILYQIVFTIIFLVVSKKLYNFFFKPIIYSWEDPAMKLQTPEDKRKRETKARKRIGTLPPFPNGWYKILCSNELLPGQVKYISALGKEWAVFRTKSGKPGLIGAYCPHLGADLSQGTVVGEDLVCPFHAFHFDTKGTCSKIPYQEDVPKALKCQDILPIREVNNAICVWYDVDGKEPHWEVPDIFEGQANKFKFVARIHHKIHCHVQDIHENGADNAHLPVVHWKTLLGIPIFWHQWGITWEASQENKHMSNFTVNEVMKIGNVKIPLTNVNVKGHHIGAGLVHFNLKTFLGEFKVAFHTLPLEGFLQDSVYQMWASKHIPMWFAKIVVAAWVQQYERDIVIWNQKMFLPAAQIVKNDGPIVQYRRWYKQFYSEFGTKNKFDLTDKDLF